MTKRATGKPFNSQTGRAASMRSPWRRQQFCHTQRSIEIRRQFDREREQAQDKRDDN